MGYSLVLSDLGGVVVEFDADRVVNQIAQLLGRAFDEVQKAVYDKELLLPFELGRISPETYYQGLKTRLNLSWSYAQFVRFWNDIFVENPDVTDIFHRLRARHTLVALSNTNTLHIEYLKTTVLPRDLFHEWIASCDVGLRKPDPAIYRLALTKAGVPPHEAVYIDDRPELVEAGKAVGLTAIRFHNSQQLRKDLSALGLVI